MLKHDKIFILIILISIVVGFSGELFFYLDVTVFGNITETAAAVGRIGGLALLLVHGTLKNDKLLFRLIAAFLVLIVIGALFKISHWSFANLFLKTGLIFIPVIYSLHFYKKKPKRRLDILKLAWVIISYSASLFVIQHYPFKQLLIIEQFLFLAMFGDFAYSRLIGQRNATN